MSDRDRNAGESKAAPPPKDPIGAIPNDLSETEPPRETTEELPAEFGSFFDRESPSVGQIPSWPVPEPERYAVWCEWAVGGLGRILEATDRRLDRRVAIKELLHRSPDAEARFIREALITARLQHPSIVPIHDLGQDATGKPFYAMKMISGRSLYEVIRGKTSLEERYALIPHVTAVVDAIAYAHEQGIVHRDLKPSNIMLGDFGETLVIDWGLAVDLTMRAPSRSPSSFYEAAAAGLTVQGTVVGTPEYMPPEQARGESVDQRADIYSLGAILYFVLCGVPPFHGESGKEIISKILVAGPPPLQRRQPGIATELAAIVVKAMARDPAQRYSSARQMSEDLRRFQTGQLVSAHRYSIPLRFWRWAKRYRLPLGIATVSILALALMGILSGNRIVRERNFAEGQWHIAEEQRQVAENRRDELILAQARSLLDRDPTAAIAWLKHYPAKLENWNKPREIAADAVSRGVARHVFDHGRDITDIAISPDGKQFASAGKDRTIRIWDLVSGNQLHAFRQEAVMNSVAFSPQGEFLAWGGQDNKVWLLSNRGGSPKELGAHSASVYQLAFSPAGDELASVAYDGTLRLWDLVGNTSRVLHQHRGKLYVLAYSMTGKMIATAGEDRVVRLWNSADGTSRPLAGHREEIYTLAFSADERLLASAGKDGDILLWDLQTRKARSLRGHQGIVSYVDFSPDSKAFVSSGYDKTIRIWDLATGSSRIFSGHEAEVEVVRYSPDRRFVISAGRDKTARIWDVQSGDSRVLRGHLKTVSRTSIFPDGVHLVTASTDGTARLWDLSLNASQALRGHQEGVMHVAFSPDGRYLASDSEDSTVRLWDVKTGESRVLRGHTQQVFGLAFSADGRKLASSSFDSTIRVWNTGTSESELLRGHEGRVVGVAFVGADSVASASSDGTVRLWKLKLGENQVLHRHAKGALALAVSPNGRFIASRGYDQVVHLWDANRNLSREFRPGEAIDQIGFSPDSRWMAAAAPSAMHLWDLESGRERAFRQHQGTVYSLTFSPNAQLVASAGSDKDIVLWTLASGSSRTLRGHEATVLSVVFDREGKYLASSSQDRTVRIWDLSTGISRILRGHRNFITSVAFSPDAEILASGGLDSDVRLWSVDSAANPPILLQDFPRWLTALASLRKELE